LEGPTAKDYHQGATNSKIFLGIRIVERSFLMPLVAVLGTVFGLLATRRTGKILVGTVIANQVIDGRRAKKKLEESERLFALGFNPEQERRET